MKMLEAGRAWRAAGAVWAGVALLSGCGGGGGGDGANGVGTQDETIVASSSVKAMCRSPRNAGVVDANGNPYPDRPGTLQNELAWVHAWIDETYLWYQDVRALPASTRSAANYNDPVTYFDALRSPAFTASGKKLDQFHFTYDTPEWVALSTSGRDVGYGMTLTFSGWGTPRSAVVAFTQDGTAAANAGLARGQQIVSVDGVDVDYGSDEWTIYAGLFPSSAGRHWLTLRDPSSGTTRTVALDASVLTSLPVHNVKTLPAPNQNVGYLQFDDHFASAEPLLVNAFTQLAAAGVTDLVIDIRYNGGGYLGIASELAYMVAGPSRTGGKVFEQLLFNDRNPFPGVSPNTPFYSQTRGYSGPAGVALPTLNLGRVFVLTTADTCSASEAIINGLRGAGVQVIQVGETTCGKPYGFYPADNCGTTYFTIQFKGVNALGFGDYADGFIPNCAVNDDFSHALGDPAERLLAMALVMRSGASCVPGAMGLSSSASVRAARPMSVLRSPLRSNRWLN